MFLFFATSEHVCLWLCVMFWKLLDVVSTKSDNSDIIELNTFQIFVSLIDINMCISELSFCRNLEVFESHLGNLPFDIHHALKVNAQSHFYFILMLFVSMFVLNILCQLYKFYNKKKQFY